MSGSKMSENEINELLAPFKDTKYKKPGLFSFMRKRGHDEDGTGVFDEPVGDVFGNDDTGVFDDEPDNVFGPSASGVFGNDDTGVFDDEPDNVFGPSASTSGFGTSASTNLLNPPGLPRSSGNSSASGSSSMFNWLPRGTTNFSSNNSFINYIIQIIVGLFGIIFSPFFLIYKGISKGISKGSSSSSSLGNGGYSFLNPSSLQLPSALTLILILMVFIVLISYWAYIKSNWEQVKCKDGRFWIAPLFGKSTQETIKDCTSKEIQITVNKNLQGEMERLADLDASVNNLQTQIDNSSGEATTLENDTNSTLTNITNILESNINYVKGALSTILASIYISSNLNKGALTSYADLQKSDIAEIIDKYNNVNMDEANLNFI